jgi:hypothetical protein
MVMLAGFLVETIRVARFCCFNVGYEYLCRVGCSVGSAVGAGAWAFWLPKG